MAHPVAATGPDEAPAGGVVGIQGAVAEKLDDRRQVGEGRRGPIRLPVHDRALSCAQQQRNLPLQETKVQPHFPQVIADAQE